MSKPKHTPGPWKLKLLETQGKGRSAGYKSIWDIDQPNNRGARSAATLIAFGEEGEANARLIAAAPELLAELEYRVQDCDDGQSGSGCGMSSTDPKYRNHSIYCIRARAAIKKARGEL